MLTKLLRVIRHSHSHEQHHPRAEPHPLLLTCKPQQCFRAKHRTLPFPLWRQKQKLPKVLTNKTLKPTPRAGHHWIKKLWTRVNSWSWRVVLFLVRRRSIVALRPTPVVSCWVSVLQESSSTQLASRREETRLVEKRRINCLEGSVCLRWTGQMDGRETDEFGE